MFRKNKCVMVLAAIGCCLAAVPSPRESYSTADNVTYPTKRAEDLESGYVVVQADPNGKMFLLSTRQKATYFGASKICKQSNMELIRVNGLPKHRLVKEIIRTYTTQGPFWMDGNKLEDTRIWRWSDGSPLMVVIWDNGEPNNAKGDEMCIELYHKDALWDDQRCTERIYFICESSNGYDMRDLNRNIISQNEGEGQ